MSPENCLKVYSDAALSGEVTSIQWGTLTPSQNVTRTVYLYSSKDLPPASVSMADVEPPGFASYADLSCNAVLLNAGAVTPLDVTLSIHPDIANITSFSFKVVISA